MSQLQDLIGLGGRVCLVTGAARGIGLATAARLHELGAVVVLTDRDGDSLEQARAGLAAERGPQRLSTRVLDVTDEQAVRHVFASVAEHEGIVDVLVNNAGIYPITPLSELTLAEFRLVHDVNLVGAFLCSREFAQCLAGAGRPGVIVMVSSGAGRRARIPGVAHYVSAKHGVEGLVKSLAVELGPAGIRVVGIAPTAVATDGLRSLDSATASALLSNGNPLGRQCTPDDVARAIALLAGAAMPMVNGSVVRVDGGAGAR